MRGVYNYAGRIQGKSLKLVDLTGFSWESVAGTLSRLHKEGISEDSWSPELFTTRKDHLQRMMGVLLEVPELREICRRSPVAGRQMGIVSHESSQTGFRDDHLLKWRPSISIRTGKPQPRR